MATETQKTTSEGFGEINRLKGRVFEAMTLLASLFGIVALGILLGYVFWDAFGLESADMAWFGVFSVLVILPLGLFTLYTRRNRLAGEVSLELFSTSMAGILGGFAIIAVLDVIAGYQIWFTYFATLVAPLGLLYIYSRVNPKFNWIGLTYIGVGILGPILGSILGPGIGMLRFPILTNTAEMLGGPTVYFISLVIPASIVVRYVVGEHLELWNGDYAAALLLLFAIIGIPIVDQLALVSRSDWFIFLTTFFAPLCIIVARNLSVRERWVGFLGPLTLITGVILMAFIPDLFGIAGPAPWFDWQYITSNPSRFADQAGLYPAIIGSVFIIVLVAIITLLLAVGAAIYLEEYAPSSGIGEKIARLIRINISNLAGVPSVVYGILGLAVFANLLNLGVGTVITAAFTLSLLILPIVIIATREAIDSVPNSLRQASYGMGATRWQTVRSVILPRALPGTLTGTILALGRAIGETAPLIMIGVATTTFSPPDGLFSRTSAMPMQVFVWATYPSREFQHGVVAAGVVTLLVVLLTMNSIAILLRNRYEKEAF